MPDDATSSLFGWMLLGHMIGLAVLAGGIGTYVAGLHRLGAATTADHLQSARPTVRWGEQLTLVGFGLLVATGVGLGAVKSAFGQAWLLTSLALLALIGAVGRISGSRLDALFADLAPSEPGAAVGSDESLCAAARSLAIHLPADVTVVAILELVYLMTLRPGWWGIGTSLAVAAMLVLGAAWALSRGAHPPAANPPDSAGTAEPGVAVR